MNLKLDGKWTKLLKAFAVVFGLEHAVEVGDNYVRVDVFVKNEWYESILDVFEEGKVAYVSSMSRFSYLKDDIEDIVDVLSRKILEGTFGERRCIKSMKGGDCCMVRDGKLVPVPQFVLKDIPRSLEELMVRLGLAGVDPEKMTIETKEEREC